MKYETFIRFQSPTESVAKKYPDGRMCVKIHTNGNDALSEFLKIKRKRLPFDSFAIMIDETGRTIKQYNTKSGIVRVRIIKDDRMIEQGKPVRSGRKKEFSDPVQLAFIVERDFLERFKDATNEEHRNGKYSLSKSIRDVMQERILKAEGAKENEDSNTNQ